MAKQRLTIYQKLTKTFGFQGQIQGRLPSFEFSKDELLRTDSKEDFEKARLQAQQSQYIADKWSKLDMSLYNQSVYYEPNRLSAYYDYESMEFCLAGETKIATPNGFITIKELSDKGKKNEFIVYSYDHNLKKIVPAIAKNAHHTRDEMTYKVTFDDNSYIIGTLEHRLMKRDGSFARISELKEGESMMPFYRKSFYNNENYNWIYTCNSNEGHHGWVAEHDLISEWFYDVKKELDEEVHHIDFNGKNNLPENLKIMKINEHRTYHAQIHNKKIWADSDYRTMMSEVAKRKGKYHWNGKRSGSSNPAYFHIPFDLIIETAIKNKTLKGTSKLLNIAHTKLQREIMNAGYKDWSVFCDAYGITRSKYSTAKVKGEKYALNHKVLTIEPYGIIPVYDLTVPGFKNFATDTIFSHNTPEVSAALDIYAEESTTKSEKGQVLTILSDSKRIKHILDDLFYNVLDVNTNLTMWTRGMCKYGDNFVYLKIDPDKGIIGCQQLPNIEIQRLEGARQSSPNQSDRIGSRFPTRELRFTWTNKDMEFQAWEIAHFRILGDDRKLPYGTSMLDKIRRIWKQLLLAEDAMLIYRTSRAPERRVFKVFVGNMDDKDIEPYVQRVANKFKRAQVVDQTNGQVDMRYNQMAVDQDYFIPVRDMSQASPIETLPGAQNLGEIADIEYIQKKMMAALRIPKAFLGFEDVIGNGKGLALLDIRFARTINRIQQSAIQELNKIALIHLFLLGLEDELNNFTLALTNPSGQSDLLRIESWKEKITMYKDATSDQSQMGILPVSHTWAKKNILGMSDNEVILDLQQQRMERAIGFELTNTQNIIKRTGVFDEVDKKYGIPEEDRKKVEATMASGGGAAPGGAPGGGGMPTEMAPTETANTGAAPTGAGAPPLGESKSESRKFKILSMLGDDDNVVLEDLFDAKKAKKNIYEIDKAINDILNQ
jgi:Bacteriophage T4-like portal protein (Gp20)/Intein splicing domain